MGISDKIEVAMTAIDDDKMDNAIAIPIKMDNVIHSMKAKNSFKKCGAHWEFLFCLLKLLLVLFSRFLHQRHACSGLLEALPHA